jgi:hypothetical protein
MLRQRPNEALKHAFRGSTPPNGALEPSNSAYSEL